MNLACIIIIGKISPFRTKFKNKISLFNETCILFLTFTMTLETDFCQNVEFRYNTGYFFIFIVFVCISVNLKQIFSSFFRKIYLYSLKYCKLIKISMILLLEFMFPRQLRVMVCQCLFYVSKRAYLFVITLPRKWREARRQRLEKEEARKLQ